MDGIYLRGHAEDFLQTFFGRPSVMAWRAWGNSPERREVFHTRIGSCSYLSWMTFNALEH
jgi:hypothetical protein